MSNSFPTKNGATVTGAVAMALDDDGNAVPVEEGTAIGTVTLSQKSIDALAAAIAAALGKKEAR